MELQQLKYIKTEYEGKFSMLTSEIERLNIVLKQSLESVNEYKHKISRLELELQDSNFHGRKSSILNQEIERLQAIIDDLNRELEIYRYI